MSTHDDLARMAATAGVGRIFFDQCVFGAPTLKATHIIASNEVMAHLSPRFSERFCGHPQCTHNSIVGKTADGAADHARTAQHHPTKMNAALAESIIALLPIHPLPYDVTQGGTQKSTCMTTSSAISSKRATLTLSRLTD
eukprot:2379743-Pleurochrysis_carterae.AAC.2